MKLSWTTRRQATLDMQLDVARATDYLSDIFGALEDIRFELRVLNEHLGDVPAGQLAAIASMARTGPPAPTAREVLAGIARQSAAAGKARGL